MPTEPMPELSGEPLALAELERRTLEHNPEILQAQAAIRAAEGLRRQVGLYPNPTLGVAAEEIPLESGRDGGKVGGFLAQPIVTGGKLRLNRRIFEQEVERAEAVAELARLREVNRVRMLHAETVAAQRMVELAVKHACEREQFGVPIGSFQAVKHMLADVAVKLEYARTAVARAAHSVARGARTRAVDVSMAKLLACEAATETAKTALQVHGAIGYTWEHDLHLWMRRAWSLALEWGDGAWHRARLADAVIDAAHPAESFGYSAPGA